VIAGVSFHVRILQYIRKATTQRLDERPISYFNR
jgi:hypothetical protein